MNLPTKSNPLAPLYRQGGSVPSLPATVTTARPGLIDRFFASREEREVLAERDQAVRAVEVAKVQAATRVALGGIAETEAIAHKSRESANRQVHDQLEEQMVKREAETHRVLNSVTNHSAFDIIADQQRFLTEMQAEAEKLGISPEWVQMLRDVAKYNTEQAVGGLHETREMVREAAQARKRLALLAGKG